MGKAREINDWSDQELAQGIIAEWVEDHIVDSVTYHTDPEYHAFIYRLSMSAVKGLRRKIR